MSIGYKVTYTVANIPRKRVHFVLGNSKHDILNKLNSHYEMFDIEIFPMTPEETVLLISKLSDEQLKLAANDNVYILA